MEYNARFSSQYSLTLKVTENYFGAARICFLLPLDNWNFGELESEIFLPFIEALLKKMKEKGNDHAVADHV